jgi:hypothetical protein
MKTNTGGKTGSMTTGGLIPTVTEDLAVLHRLLFQDGVEG